MNDVLRKRVELLANVSIVAVSLLIGFTTIRDKFLNRAPAAADTGAASTASERRPMVEPGQQVSLPGVDWAQSPQTLVLVLSKGCHFCTESADFYRELARQNAGRNDLRIVAALPQDVATGKGYLDELGVRVDAVVQASPATLNARGTPTLLLVDSAGAVKDVWVGRLPDDKQAEVLRQLKG
jgi:hypothetical protein